MCLDIIIREKSNGEKGILWLMKQLSNKYGKDKPFEDDKIIDEIVALTYTEVGSFFNKHVIGNTPIDYSEYLNKVGLKFDAEMISTGFFMHGQIPFIDANANKRELFFRKTELNSSLKNIGIQGGDIIKSVNGKEYNLDNARDMIISSFSWKPEDPVEITVEREGKEITLSGKTGTPELNQKVIVGQEKTNNEQDKLREAWLKG